MQAREKEHPRGHTAAGEAEDILSLTLKWGKIQC